MKRSTAEHLARLYPDAWRNRFGEEFIDILEGQRFGPGLVWDVARAAMNERVRDLTTMEARVAYASNVSVLAGRPSGFIPLLFSLAALGTALVVGATTAGVRHPDEGAAAHIFQLLIVAQIPVIAYFVVRWVPGRRWAALTVLAAQALAIASAIAAVWYYRL